MYQNNRSRRTRAKRIAAPKGILIAAALLLAAVILAGGLWMLKNRTGSTDDNKQSTSQTASFDKTQFSLTDPASPWIIVNKKQPLSPKDYVPAGLRTPSMDADAGQQVNEQTAAALEAMSSAAAAEGVNLKLVSAYRSYDTQTSIYESEVRGFGQVQADRESARPGHSEHQTGWAADLGAANGKCEIKACFADTPEGQWLAAKAHEFGFIIRYPEGKEHITGYMYEPWHLRFVGINLSTEIHNQDSKTLEEFFGLPPAPNY